MGICFLLTFGTFISQQVSADDFQAIESNLKQQAADAENKAAQDAQDKLAQEAQNAKNQVLQAPQKLENQVASVFKGW